VLERCTIEDIPVRIEASLIGKECKIQRSRRKPSAYRFMVGDASSVDVL
jgi:glucose-1-phosphate thymidylyltransferase